MPFLPWHPNIFRSSHLSMKGIFVILLFSCKRENLQKTIFQVSNICTTHEIMLVGAYQQYDRHDEGGGFTVVWICCTLASGEISWEVYEWAIRSLIQEAQEPNRHYRLFAASFSFRGRKDWGCILRMCLAGRGDLPSHSVQTANPVGCKGDV